MKKLVLALMCTSALVFNIACSSSQKKEGQVGVGDVDSDGNVIAKDMKFDPQGSDSGNITGLYTVYFGYDAASIDAQTKNKLKENADWIKNNTDVTIQIEGHADKRGSVEYNLALGERRAKSVKNYLVSLGVPADRLTIISYGKEKLLSFGDSESDHSKNRRANFVPLPN